MYNLFQGAKLLNWIAPTTKVCSIVQFEYISRNNAFNEKKKKLYPDYGDNGGMMAYMAVHGIAVQEKLIDELHQIEVKTLICAGTDDKINSTEGNCNSKLNSNQKNYLTFQRVNLHTVEFQTVH